LPALEYPWPPASKDLHGRFWFLALIKEGKQAEFLLEHGFPWELVERIGVKSTTINHQVLNALPLGGHRPPVELPQVREILQSLAGEIE